MAIRQNKPYSVLPTEVMEFTADSAADIANLPTAAKAKGGFDPVPWGSICIVMGTGGGCTAYMLNSSDKWIEL